MKKTNNTRFFGYDLIKTLAMFFIVLYHFNSLDFGQIPEEGWYIPNNTKFFYAFCSAGVPLFFMVNGALQGSKNIPVRKCFEKSMRLLFVAIFWAIIFMYILFPLIKGMSLPSFGGLKEYYWFLYTLAELYWITYVLNRSQILKKTVVILLLLFPFTTNLYWDIVVASDTATVMPSWGRTGLFTMYSIVYYYLGAFLAKKEMPIYVSLLITIVGLLIVNADVVIMSTHDHRVFDGVNACFPTFGAMMISIGLFAILKKVRLDRFPKVRKTISLVGSSTIGIYVFHLFLIIMIRDYVFNNSIQNPFVIIVSTMCVVVLTTLISQAIMHSPLKFLLKL